MTLGTSFTDECGDEVIVWTKNDRIIINAYNNAQFSPEKAREFAVHIIDCADAMDGFGFENTIAGVQLSPEPKSSQVIWWLFLVAFCALLCVLAVYV